MKGSVALAACLLARVVTVAIAGAPTPTEHFLSAALNNDLPMLKVQLAAGVDIDVADGWGETALMTAAAWGRVEIVEHLLKAGADPFLQSKEKKTAADKAQNDAVAELLFNAQVIDGAKMNRAGEAAARAETAGAAKRRQQILQADKDDGDCSDPEDMADAEASAAAAAAAAAAHARQRKEGLRRRRRLVGKTDDAAAGFCRDEAARKGLAFTTPEPNLVVALASSEGATADVSIEFTVNASAVPGAAALNENETQACFMLAWSAPRGVRDARGQPRPAAELVAPDVVAQTVVARDVCFTAERRLFAKKLTHGNYRVEGGLKHARAGALLATAELRFGLYPRVSTEMRATYSWQVVPDGWSVPSGTEVSLPVDGAGVRRMRIPRKWQLQLFLNKKLGYWRAFVSRSTTTAQLQEAARAHLLKLGCTAMTASFVRAVHGGTTVPLQVDQSTAEELQLFQRRFKVRAMLHGKCSKRDRLKAGKHARPVPEEKARAPSDKPNAEELQQEEEAPLLAIGAGRS